MCVILVFVRKGLPTLELGVCIVLIFIVGRDSVGNKGEETTTTTCRFVAVVVVVYTLINRQVMD